MTAQATWIIAADGAKARFFVRQAPGVPLEELADLALTATAELRLQRHASAVHDGADHGHHALADHHDKQDEGEHHFLSHIAGRINLAVENHAIGRLAICAPPRALGALRDHLSPAAVRLVAAEIAKDVVRETVCELDDRMKAHKV